MLLAVVIFRFIEIQKTIPFIFKFMNTYIFIHGGESFSHEKEYEEFISETLVEWNLEAFAEKETKKKWKTELAKKLTSSGNRVYLPNFPNSMNAKYNEWKIFFEKWIEKVEIVGNIIFIGNSLGGCFLLRYFSEDDLKIHTNTIHSIHLVATCLSAGDFKEGENYYLLKKLKENIFIWHAEDDTVVPISDAKKLSEILPDGQKILFPKEKGYGHFHSIERFVELEKVLLFS